MLPMLLKPRAVASASAPAYSAQGYTRLWAATAKSGAVSGTVASDTGLYAVKWWDGSTETINSGGYFSKSGSGNRAFEVYPAALQSPAVVGGGVTLRGPAQISSAQSMFGSSSAFFNGSGAYAAGTLSFNWTSDWTVEFWMRRTGAGVGGVSTIFQAGDIQGGRGGVHLYTTASGTFLFNDAITGAIEAGSATLNQWIHVAVVRSSGTNSLYVNGTRVGTSTQTFPVEVTGYSIGGSVLYGFYSQAYIDEFRITQAALYSGTSLTVPTSALTSGSETAVLLRFDSSSYGPDGGFDGFNVSGNEITSLRAESVTLSSTAGYSQYVSWVKHYGVNKVYIPGVMEQGNLSSNSLNAAALDQFYTDLLTGTGALYVESNAGTASDTPSIATTKGYTVYGSA
jgi:hypothetical protein